MKCVILQPSYIPWRGYFHQIGLADTFVFYDDVQYDARGWRNRNRIKTPTGPHWLTIPVHAKGSQTHGIPILDIEIDGTKTWNDVHWQSLSHSYKKAPFFTLYEEALSKFFNSSPSHLVDFIIPLTETISKWLGFEARFLRSSTLTVEGKKTDRLINILTKIGADHYISGPSAKDYIEPEKFDKAGIKLEFMDYHYPEYEQLYPPFDPQISILDLLFMKGPEASKYIL